MADIKNINADKFEEEVIKSATPVLVDFWATWCGPCQMMEPILEKLAEDYKGKIKIVKVDVDAADNQEVAMKYQVSSIPNMKLFKDGIMVKEYIGFRQEDSFKKELEAVL